MPEGLGPVGDEPEELGAEKKPERGFPPRVCRGPQGVSRPQDEIDVEDHEEEQGEHAQRTGLRLSQERGQDREVGEEAGPQDEDARRLQANERPPGRAGVVREVGARVERHHEEGVEPDVEEVPDLQERP